MSRSPAARRLNRQLRRTLQAHELLNDGDRVLVAVSGGKDSMTLLHLLEDVVRAQPGVHLVAVHLDQQQPGYDGSSLVEWLRVRSVPFEVLQEDTYSVVTERLSPQDTYCSMCSRLRRGILYTAAERLGCNKLALGHHRDDALETLLLNLFYAGRLQALPARYTTDDGRFEVIRPLIECAQADIATYAAEQGFPIIPCNLCGSQPGLKRQVMAQLLDTLERDNPNLRSIMLNALTNVSPTHLLDRDLVRAWNARPAEVRPAQVPVSRPRHARALPVIST